MFDLNAEIINLIPATAAGIISRCIFHQATLCGEYLPQ